MNITGIKLNGKELSSYGARLLSGLYSALLTPAEVKPWVKNDPIDDNGVDYIKPEGGAKVAERVFNLTFQIQGATENEFLQHYSAFISELQKDMVELYVPDLNRTLTLKYLNATPYDTYELLSCKLAVKFEEPKPLNYAEL
jgi:hypothetical protein